MKKTFLSLVSFLFLCLFTHAAAPTATGSNLKFASIDGKSFDMSLTAGNGAMRLVVMKEGSPVLGRPMNGKEYQAYSSFGTAGAEFVNPGEYVVAKTGWSSFNATNLKPGTVYYVAIFEYNGTGATAEYLNLPLEGSQQTAVAPTVQAAFTVTTNIAGNAVTLNFAKGNGTGRMVIARKGNMVTAIPTDVTLYYDDASFGGTSSKIGTDNYIVYKGVGSSVTVRNLEPNATYTFTVYEYNGNTYPVFLAPAPVTTVTTNAGPTAPPTSMNTGTVEGNRFDVACSAGNGTARLFIVRKGQDVTGVPVNGTTYAANASFGSGYEIAPGEFVVSAGGANAVTITNLEPATTYYIRAYEYDVDKAGNTYYYTAGWSSKAGTTAVPPSTAASGLNIQTMNGNSATIAFTAGNGVWRMAIMKEGSAVDAKPSNLLRYTGNAAFGSGTQITPGNYVMVSGMNGTSFSVSNLKPGITYHVALYEYNGYNYPVYGATAGTFSFTVPLEPTVASKSPYFQGIDGASLRLVWTSGNGAKRIIVARKGSAPQTKPVDGVSYAASTNFGEGDQLAPGEFVVYNGDYYYIDLKKFEPGSTYHFAAYEYNVDGNGNPDYLTSSWMTASTSTATWPTTQPGISSVTAIQSAQATVNFTAGNGAGRLFVMKEGAAPDFLLQDLARYAYGAFGAAAGNVGNGNYVVFNTSYTGNFTVTGLKPKTTYYIAGFEFGGNMEPVYLRTAPTTVSFTTADVPGATVPTTASTSAVISNIDGNKLSLKWTSGNGSNRLVVMRKGTAIDFVPASATIYTAAAAFGTSTDLGGGQYAVYNGSGNSVDLTNLDPSSTYSFAVFEYNGTADLLRYLTGATLSGVATTAAAPTTVVSNVNASAGNGSLTLTWTAGNGAGRLVVMKEGSAPQAQPADLSVYPANTVFKSGSQMALGEYVVYAGTGNTVTVTGLSNKMYYYSIYEFNGSTAPVYNTARVVNGSVAVSSTLPVRLVDFAAKQNGDGVLLTWATLQEQASSYFAVERSTDGIRFQTVGTVNAAGNSTARVDYRYADAPGANGKVYYRLRQVDVDGKVEYSAVLSVDVVNAASAMAVYPNPFVSTFRLQLPVGTAAAQVKLYDASGALRISRSVRNGQAIDAPALAAGTYFLVAESGAQKFTARLIKQ